LRGRRALVTGVGGQDGSLLARLLLDEGYDVAGVVRREPEAYAESLGDLVTRIDLVHADLLRHDSLVDALRATRPTEVYNLAAPSFVPRSWDEPIVTAEFAAVGATSMLEAIRQVDPGIRFYQASSSEIFGEPRETPQTEETAASPLTP
jgi:GDPmannose 4,6-dehydratase